MNQCAVFPEIHVLFMNTFDRRAITSINSMTDILIGPVSLTLHSSEQYSKTIYTFGETHVCNTVSANSSGLCDFLFQILVKNADVSLLLEETKKEIACVYVAECHLKHVNERFHKQLFDGELINGNSVHWTDLRCKFEDLFAIFREFSCKLFKHDKQDRTSARLYEIDQLYFVMQLLKRYNFDKLLQDPEILEQLNLIQDPALRDIIKRYWNFTDDYM